jgi:hypothetical protein
MRTHDQVVAALAKGGWLATDTGVSFTARCPAHGGIDANLKGKRSPEDGSTAIFKCWSHDCTTEEVLRALGLWRERKPTPPGTVLRWEARLATDPGKPLASHVIRYGADGKKSAAWEPPIRKDLSVGTNDLAFYRAWDLTPGPGTVVVCEGERATEAVRAAGFEAVGTYGTGHTPSDAALAVLDGKDTVLWPDADDPGRRSMAGLAARLGAVRVVDTSGFPEGWDAADASPEEIPRIVAAARVPEVRVSARDGERSVTLTRASTIRPRPVRWLWEYRLALGTFGLLGGREGVGKSLEAIYLAAATTRGLLPGMFFGTPKDVIIAVTEDAWEFTIVPRLLAAGADLDRVHRVDVSTNGVLTGLSLPRDLRAVERLIAEVDAALILLDPLMSRLDADLDTYKDAEVRLALEPLVAVAERTESVMLGLIHVSKAHTTDPLTMLMASRAFTAVARSVLFMVRDPGDESLILLGQPKNNLGRSDLPSIKMRIEVVRVADTEEGEVHAPRVVIVGEDARSIREVIEETDDSVGMVSLTSTADAAGWLSDYLSVGPADKQKVIAEGRKAGHPERTIERAARKIKVHSSSAGFPRHAVWSRPSAATSGESGGTDGNGGTGGTGTAVPPLAPVPPVVPIPPEAGGTRDRQPLPDESSDSWFDHAPCSPDLYRAHQSGVTRNPNGPGWVCAFGCQYPDGGAMYAWPSP